MEQSYGFVNGIAIAVALGFLASRIKMHPGFDFLHLTPPGWFNLTWAFLVITSIMIVMRHYRSPLPIIPGSPLARGQLIFLILLWIMVVANFERALTVWHPSRMLTEWVIFINAIIATALVLLLPRESENPLAIRDENDQPLYKRLWITAVAAFAISSAFVLVTNRAIYHYPEYDKLDHKQYHTRFGPDASWKTKPNLKNEEHK